jgi:hypothetical protein
VLRHLLQMVQRSECRVFECRAVWRRARLGLAVDRRERCSISTTSRLLPFQPMSMTAAQLAAVSFLARYAGHSRRTAVHVYWFA